MSHDMPMSRREILQAASGGFGYLALAGLFASQARAETPDDPLAPRPPHFPARAKRVIFLFMEGGPSHVDTFDPKPRLDKDHGQAYVGESIEVQPEKKDKPRPLMRSPWKFSRHGESGLWVSGLFPEVARHADKLCVLNGMHTDPPDHPQAVLMMHTGSFQFSRPSIGAWLLYGLGNESQELPGFIALKPVRRADSQGSAFLPAAYQPTRIGDGKTPITSASFPHLSNDRFRPSLQRAQLNFARGLTRERTRRGGDQPELEGVIDSGERAFQMQASMPGLMDLSTESKATQELYGIGTPATDEFGRRCLLARRFAEAGVRFIELAHYPTAPGGGWDQHKDLEKGHADNARAVDKPIAGLLTDLAARGLLEDTLVLWGGEFGRTPWSEGGTGRDHNPNGFTMWMAGGGVRGGFRHGATDDHGARAVEGKVHVHDLHATILHLLGLDHEKLTYHYSGRDFRLTDVHGRVVKEIFA